MWLLEYQKHCKPRIAILQPILPTLASLSKNKLRKMLDAEICVKNRDKLRNETKKEIHWRLKISYVMIWLIMIDIGKRM